MQIGNIEQLNQRNLQFWLEQSGLLETRICNETLLEIATKDMHSDAVRGFPLKLHKTIEKALEDAEGTARTVQSAFSRKGGRAPKSDALQDLILQIAIADPRVTAGRLLQLLNGDHVPASSIP